MSKATEERAGGPPRAFGAASAAPNDTDRLNGPDTSPWDALSWTAPPRPATTREDPREPDIPGDPATSSATWSAWQAACLPPFSRDTASGEDSRDAEGGPDGRHAAESWLEDYDAAELYEPVQPERGWPDPGPLGATDPGAERDQAGFGGWDHVDSGAGKADGAQPFATTRAADAWGVRPDPSLGGGVLPGQRQPAPGRLRRIVQQASRGLARRPESPARRRERDLVARACTPVTGGHHRVAVLSLKGGVGKTTTVMGLGLTLATLRGDRVIAVDANPDRGTLCDKLRLETSATVRDLVNERDQVEGYADMRAYTTQTAGRLEVLASDRDPTVSVAFSEQDYRTVAAVLERHYSICLTDCGTGLLHSAMTGVLALADQIVLVSTPSVDGARSASATLDWLAAHGHGALARDAVMVLSMVRRRSRTSIDLGRLEGHFAARCRSVVTIPHDAHLEEGAEVDLAQLDKATAAAYLALAADVAGGFARPARAGRPHGPGGAG